MRTLRVGLIGGSGQNNAALRHNVSCLTLEYNYPDSNSFTPEHRDRLSADMYGWMPLIVEVIIQGEYADHYYFAGYNNSYLCLNSQLLTDYDIYVEYYNKTLSVELIGASQNEHISEVRVYNCVYPVYGSSILTTQNTPSVYKRLFDNICFYGPGKISSTNNSETVTMAVPVYQNTITDHTTLVLQDSQLTVSTSPSMYVLGTYQSQNGNPDCLSNGSSNLLTGGSGGSILTSDGIYVAKNKLLWNKNHYALMALINSDDEIDLNYAYSKGKWSTTNSVNENITGGEYSDSSDTAIFAITWGQWAYWNGTGLDWKH